MKKFVSVLLAFILIFSLPFAAFSYKRGGNLTLEVTKSAVPNKTAYIDLLIELDENDENYITCSDEEIMTFDDGLIKLKPDFEIVQYKDDEGFVSYAAHYKDAFIMTYDEYADTYDMYVIQFNEEFLSFREKYNNVKIAYVASDGEILAVSNAVSMMDKHLVVEFQSLSAARAKLTAETITNYYAVIFFGIITLVALAIVYGLISIIYSVVKRRRKRTDNLAAKQKN